jgi:hypothetical protein
MCSPPGVRSMLAMRVNVVEAILCLVAPMRVEVLIN